MTETLPLPPLITAMLLAAEDAYRAKNVGHASVVPYTCTTAEFIRDYLPEWAKQPCTIGATASRLLKSLSNEVGDPEWVEFRIAEIRSMLYYTEMIPSDVMCGDAEALEKFETESEIKRMSFIRFFPC